MIRETFYWTVITKYLLLHCLASIKTDTELISTMPKNIKTVQGGVLFHITTVVDKI